MAGCVSASPALPGASSASGNGGPAAAQAKLRRFAKASFPVEAGEVAPGHPLHAAVGTIRPDDVLTVELAPLSERAVETLAGEAAREVYEATGGNPTAPCFPGAQTLCLNNGRFRVQAEWRTDQGTSGVGNAEPLTNDTGYFWFFNAANIEVVTKVLNACTISDRYWVFAGGLTDVEVDITVTDTETGAVATYRNPVDTPFQPIQDVEAFATCP